MSIGLQFGFFENNNAAAQLDNSSSNISVTEQSKATEVERISREIERLKRDVEIYRDNYKDIYTVFFGAIGAVSTAIIGFFAIVGYAQGRLANEKLLLAKTELQSSIENKLSEIRDDLKEANKTDLSNSVSSLQDQIKKVTSNSIAKIKDEGEKSNKLLNHKLNEIQYELFDLKLEMQENPNQIILVTKEFVEHLLDDEDGWEWKIHSLLSIMIKNFDEGAYISVLEKDIWYKFIGRLPPEYSDDADKLRVHLTKAR